MLRIEKGDDRYTGPYEECAEVYKQIMELGPPSEATPGVCDIASVRALVKRLGLTGITVRKTIGAGMGWPAVRIPRARYDASLSGAEAVRRHYERRDVVNHLEKVIEAYFPACATEFPDNPFEDGCRISLSVG